MSTVGACMVICNANYAVQLCIESARKYHPNLPLYIGVTLSQDGAREYAQPLADYFYEEYTTHGRMLDHLCKQVKEDYILIMDSDVEFTTNCIDKMVKELEDNDAFCVCRTPRSPVAVVNWDGVVTTGMARIDPSCALFRKDQLMRILNVFSFTNYITKFGPCYFYDTAAMVSEAARLLGFKVIERDWIWDDCIHFGGISFIPQDGTIDKTDPATAIRLKQYDVIQKHLKQLRASK